MMTHDARLYSIAPVSQSDHEVSATGIAHGSSNYENDCLHALRSEKAVEVSCHSKQRACPFMPTEILDLIFAHVRCRKDMGSVSLASRRWKDIMARHMWAALVTDFRPSMTRQRSALLNPQSAILIHIRRLVIMSFSNPLLGGSGEEDLRRFLENMPQHRLREFKCFSALSPKTFKDLIIWQSKLERFDGYIKPIVADFQHCDWLLPHLSSIRFYKLVLRESTVERSLRIHKILFQGMSGLKQLHVCYDYRHISTAPEHAFVDVRSAFTDCICFPRLVVLSLCGVDISSSSQLFLGLFNLSKLRTLRLLDCIGVTTALNSISGWYSKNTGRLDTLHFNFPRVCVATNQGFPTAAVERFLMACPPLVSLRIEQYGPHPVRMECISRHGGTLQSLTLGTFTWPVDPGPDAPSYSAEDLEAILKTCRFITTLSIDMPFRSVNLGSVHDMGRGFELIKQKENESYIFTEFETILWTIAKHPNVRRIRMLNLPKISYSSPINFSSDSEPISDHDAYLCQALMQKFASEVFRFLAERNSTVQFLDVYPLLTPPLPPRMDGNGHKWPIYAYKAHKTSFEGHITGWMKPCKDIYFVTDGLR